MAVVSVVQSGEERRTRSEPDDELHAMAEEVRVAMALNGGVSLAVWMGGCAVELDAARRAHLGPEPLSDDAAGPPPRTLYHALCNAFRRELVIDLMSGSSAGGINGALLAAAVHGERRLHPDYIRDKWISLGDFQELLHPLRAAAPTSLMSGVSFHAKLHAAFSELLPAGGPGGPGRTESLLQIPANQRAVLQAGTRVLSAAVKLDVTTTDVLGEKHRFRDTWGEELIAHEYRHRFQFRGAADFTPDRLADAARSSASFPIAFEPWEVDGARLNLPGRRWLIDGGLLDNAPIRAVLDLVPVRPSSRKVRRFVCYLNADPPLEPSFATGQHADANANGNGRPHGPQLQDVLGYMVNLPRKATFVDQLLAIQRASGRVVAVKEANESLMALDRGALRQTAEALLPAYRSRRRILALEEHLDRRPAAVSTANRRVREHGGELPWIPTTVEPPVRPGQWGWGVKAAERVLHLMLDLIRHASDYLESNGAALERAPLIEARKAVYERVGQLEAIHARVTSDEHTGRLVESLAADDDVETTLCCLRCRMLNPDYDPAIQRLVRATAQDIFAIREPLGLACADEPREVPIAEALFGDRSDAPSFDDDVFSRFLERTLCIEVLRRGFVADEHVDTDQELAFAQITPCAQTLMLTHRPLHPGDEVPQRPDQKLTGTRWAHFAGFYRESWRANDFMWGRLDAAVRVVDMLVDPDRARWVRDCMGVEVAQELTDALAPPAALSGDGASDGRRWLIAEALVDATPVEEDERYREAEWRRSEVTRLLAEDVDVFRERLRHDIEEDLLAEPRRDGGVRRGALTRALCVRAAQWEVLLHELPIVVELSKTDLAAGTATAPLDPVCKPWCDVIAALRTDPPLPKRLGSGAPAEQASTLMIRTATHSALVGLAAIRGTKLPLGRALSLPSALLLPIAGLVARKLPYALAVAAAYWAFAVFLAARVVTVGTDPSGSWKTRSVALVLTYLAVVGIVAVCLVPFWRALRAPGPGAAVKQGAWLVALLGGAYLTVGFVMAAGAPVGDIAAQSDAREPPLWLAGLVLLTVGFPRGLPRLVRRVAAREQRAPWSGPAALVVTLAPWLALAGWAALWPLRQVITDASDPWRVAAAILSLVGPPIVACGYIALSNRRWRDRRTVIKRQVPAAIDRPGG